MGSRIIFKSFMDVRNNLVVVASHSNDFLFESSYRHAAPKSSCTNNINANKQVVYCNLKFNPNFLTYFSANLGKNSSSLDSRNEYKNV